MLSNYRNYWISDSSFSTKLEISWWKNQLLKYFLFIKKSIQNVSFGCWKDPDAGKDWRQKKGTTVDEMVGWHHWPNGHEFGQTPGVGDGQGGLAYCSPWGHKESDTTEWLNWTDQQNIVAIIWCQSCCLPQSELKLTSVHFISSTLLLGMCVCVRIWKIRFISDYLTQYKVNRRNYDNTKGERQLSCSDLFHLWHWCMLHLLPNNKKHFN